MTDRAPQLVLASASAARARLLSAAGLHFATDPADIDEPAVRAQMEAGDATAEDIAAELARRKAAQAGARNPGRIVLGADQVLVHHGALLGKAPDKEAATAQLRALRGNTHQLLSAAALYHDGRERWCHVGKVTLEMRAFSDGFLDRYLEDVGDLVLDSVGCYHLEGLGAQLFSRVDGDYFTVLGLPLLEVLAALRSLGVLDT